MALRTVTGTTNRRPSTLTTRSNVPSATGWRTPSAIRTRSGEWRVRLYSDQAPVDFVWVWPYQRIVPPDQEPDEADLELPPAELPLIVDTPDGETEAEPEAAPAAGADDGTAPDDASGDASPEEQP